MDFLKCRLCNIKELPKTKDRTDNTLYIYKGEPRIWKNGRLDNEKNKDKIRQYKKEYHEKNKEYFLKKKKEYDEKNKDKIRQYKKEYDEKNKDKIRQQKKQHYQENKDKIKEYREKNKDKNKEYYNEYREKNKDKMREYKKNYKCEHNKAPRKCVICNPLSYLTELQGGRIRNALNSKKDKHTIEYLGCDKKTLYNHLEKQFKDGMSWKNKGEWHIDHIRPCASFNLELEEEIMKCFHYTNLQPLWATDNLSKSNKYDEKTHPLKWNGEKWIIK